jgi:hypothetical protein
MLPQRSSLKAEYSNIVLALNSTCLYLAIRKQAKGVECNEEPDALCVSLSTLTVVVSTQIYGELYL